MLVLWGVGVNATLAVIKVVAGVWGHSNALLADGLESALDVVSSALIWGALLYAGKPPTRSTPTATASSSRSPPWSARSS